MDGDSIVTPNRDSIPEMHPLLHPIHDSQQSDVDDTQPQTENTFNEENPDMNDDLDDENISKGNAEAKPHGGIKDVLNKVNQPENVALGMDTNDVQGNNSKLRTSILPVARIKRIMKTDSEVSTENLKLSNEAVSLVAVATELFLEYFVETAYQRTKRSGKKTLSYNDLANTVKESEAFEFLTDILPPMEAAPIAVKKRRTIASTITPQMLGQTTLDSMMTTETS